jgi:hypothetical protein
MGQLFNWRALHPPTHLIGHTSLSLQLLQLHDLQRVGRRAGQMPCDSKTSPFSSPPLTPGGDAVTVCITMMQSMMQMEAA